jgi:hypothetical protein
MAGRDPSSPADRRKNPARKKNERRKPDSLQAKTKAPARPAAKRSGDDRPS